MNNIIKKIILTIIILSLLSLITNAYLADGQYHWECLQNGESLVYYDCESDCCITCQKDGYTGPFYRCQDMKMCSCDGGISDDNETPVITINSPEEDFASTSYSIMFDITISESVSLYYYDDLYPQQGYKRLSYDTDSYYRKMYLKEGYHTLTFKGVDKAGNKGYQTIHILVDAKKPRITKTLPRSGDYVSDTFTIYYSETNLESIELYYQEQGDTAYKKMTKTDCPSGDSQECQFIIDDLKQGEVKYYFVVKDKANTVTSSESTVIVDTVDPNIELNKPQSQGYTLGIQDENTPVYPSRSVDFDVQVDEEVTLEYIDYQDLRPRYLRLCSRCTGYDRSRSFSEGFHDLTIRAADNAGNTDEISLSFMVDSRQPRIIRTYPSSRDYGNGEFIVEYTEDNLKSITLFYIPEGYADYADMIRFDCPSGDNQECTFNVEGLPQGELTYYFEIRDKASVVYSRDSTITIDTVAPELTDNNPLSGTLESNTVDFDFSISEEVTLEYIDNTDARPRYRRICSRCTEYQRTRYFSTGSHELTIMATDEAGNSDTITQSFII